MAGKKKTTSVRKSPRAKAGNKRRDPHTPVYRKVLVRDRKTGETSTKEVRCRENDRHGKGSNKEQPYTGYPTTYFK
jgi:hypothetical protein